MLTSSKPTADWVAWLSCADGRWFPAAASRAESVTGDAENRLIKLSAEQYCLCPLGSHRTDFCRACRFRLADPENRCGRLLRKPLPVN